MRVEKLKRSEMKSLQLERLKYIVNYAYDNVLMYKERFAKIKLKPKHIKTLKDIELIPFTQKDDLRANYPFKLLAVPMDKIVRIHTSSGTTGKPITNGFTKNDMKIWQECTSRVARMAGATSKDIVQVSFGYGLFTGGFGMHAGLEKIGCAIIPASSGNTERQLMMMKDFGTTLLVATPSYAMYLAESAKKAGIAKDLKLRLGLFGAEASTQEMFDALKDILGIFPTDNYGLTELGGPGLSGDCVKRTGMHINEDHYYPEVWDFDKNQAIAEGGQGELVVTTLTKQGMPMLRFRTKDISSLRFEPCACGRTLVRMSKIKGRTDDMMIIRGVNVFPSQIESILLEIPEIIKHYEIWLTRENHLDYIEVKVEVFDEKLLTSYNLLEKLREKVKHKLKTVLGLDVKVSLCEPFSLKRTEGKAKRVFDQRV